MLSNLIKMQRAFMVAAQKKTLGNQPLQLIHDGMVEHNAHAYLATGVQMGNPFTPGQVVIAIAFSPKTDSTADNMAEIVRNIFAKRFGIDALDFLGASIQDGASNAMAVPRAHLIYFLF